MQLKSILLTLLLLVAFQNISHAQSGIIFFNGTLEEAQEEAAKENKPLFMHGYATWNALDKKMIKKVYKDESVADRYNSSFVNVKIDLEKGSGAKAKKEYGLKKYPVVLFFDTNKELILVSEGLKEVDDMLNLANEVLSKE